MVIELPPEVRDAKDLALVSDASSMLARLNYLEQRNTTAIDILSDLHCDKPTEVIAKFLNGEPDDETEHCNCGKCSSGN